MVDSNLVGILRELSVRQGQFTLKSGKTSDLYVDVRKTALNPKGAIAIMKGVAYALRPGVTAIGGVELGAVPIVGTVLGYLSHVSAFIVRKAAKEHGTRSKIENCPEPGTKVVIIEDVTTTGGSLVEAMNAARDAGLVVVQAITVVDREEGAAEFIAAAGYTSPEFLFTALVTRSDLLNQQ